MSEETIVVSINKSDLRSKLPWWIDRMLLSKKLAAGLETKSPPQKDKEV